MNGKVFLITFLLCLAVAVIGSLVTSNAKFMWIAGAGLAAGLLIGVIMKKDDGPPIRGSHNRV